METHPYCSLTFSLRVAPSQSESGQGVASFSFEAGSLCGAGRPQTQLEMERDRALKDAAALRAELAAQGSGRPFIPSSGGGSGSFSFGGQVASDTGASTDNPTCAHSFCR